MRVSAAVHWRPSPRGCFALSEATSVSIVGVSGVSSTCAAGVAATTSAATAFAVGTTTASTFAAYVPASLRTKVSSPIGLTARNSSLAEPPMAPDTAATMT